MRRGCGCQGNEKAPPETGEAFWIENNTAALRPLRYKGKRPDLTGQGVLLHALPLSNQERENNFIEYVIVSFEYKY